MNLLIDIAVCLGHASIGFVSAVFEDNGPKTRQIGNFFCRWGLLQRMM